MNNSFPRLIDGMCATLRTEVLSRLDDEFARGQVFGVITAILDWELVHLGDPHEDLGWASLPMYKGGSPYICRLAEPEWFYRRYGEQVGFTVDMGSVHYYQVFNFLKLAATHMAAARCFEDGRFNDMRMPAMGSQIATCLRQMDKCIQQGPVTP